MTLESRVAALEARFAPVEFPAPTVEERRAELVALVEGQRESVRIAEFNQEVVEYFAALEAAPITGLEKVFAAASVTAAQILDPKSPAGKEAQEALSQANRKLRAQSRARTHAEDAANANRVVTVVAARARLKDYEEQLAALDGEK